MWGNKRFHTLNYELRKIFGEKMIKLSIDGGFTCPNRDGTVGTKGCVFCSESGSGDFAGDRTVSIKEQLEQQKQLLSDKWDGCGYIAYFQSYSNTYDTIEHLREKYTEAMNCEGVQGLAIATRSDCVNTEVAELLAEISEDHYIWVELGLQTIHEKSAQFIRRGYELSVFEESVRILQAHRIPVVVHLIIGLPGESVEDMIESVKYISSLGIDGVKLHMLHVLEHTDLAKVYRDEHFHILSMDEYIETVVELLEYMSPDITIHRLTGDGPKDLLIAPRWTLNKRAVLNGIDKALKEKDTLQGTKFY